MEPHWRTVTRQFPCGVLTPRMYLPASQRLTRLLGVRRRSWTVIAREYGRGSSKVQRPSSITWPRRANARAVADSHLAKAKPTTSKATDAREPGGQVTPQAQTSDERPAQLADGSAAGARQDCQLP